MKTRGFAVALRSSLLVAMAAGLTTAGLNYFRVKQKINNLQADLAKQTVATQRAETELARARADLAKTTDSLKATKTELERTAAEKETALATAATQTSLAAQRGDELAQTRNELEDAQRYLARFRTAGLEPEQIVQVAGQLKRLQKDVAVAEAKADTLERQVKLLTRSAAGEEPKVWLPADLRAQVISTDPKWGFVVLDIGESQGVLKNGELLVRRGDQLVGRARVSRVQKDRCVANLMPGWGLGEILEGDIAIPAMPPS